MANSYVRLAFALAMLVGVTADAFAQQPAPPRLRLVQELRIDGATHDLSGVGAVAIGPAGRIVFVEPQDFRLRFYDATGKEIARFGRRGQGPGEFDAIPGPQATRPDIGIVVVADTVSLFDRTQRRFTLITKDGQLIRSVLQPQMQPGATGGAAPQFEARAILANASILGRVRWADAPGGRIGTTGYAVASPRGDITRVLTTFGSPPVISIGAGTGSFGSLVPYVERVFESVAQDGSRVAVGVTTINADRSGKLRVLVIATGGDTLLARDMPFAGIPITKQMADSVVDIYTRSFAGRTGVSELQSKLRAEIPVARSPYAELILGLDYSIWLGKRGTPEGREYVVLDERGNPLASVQIARNARLAAATRTMVWTVETDADGLASIVRYRLVR